MGGGGSVDTSKLATSKLQEDIIEAINNIEINADSINLNTDDIEEKLDEIISNQLLNNHDVNVSNIEDTPLITGFATSAKQLPDNHQVTVSNPVTGFATSTNQTNGTQASKFVDELGVPYGVKHIQNKPRVSSMPYLFDIAEGNVPNHVSWTKNGYNGSLSATEQTLWAVGGDYVFPTANMQMEVISSSANDTSAGTGARTVEIHYLTSAFVEKTEIVTLNGLTAVPTTATDIYRINNFRVKTTGTGLQNAGNIDVRHLTDTPIYSRIMAGMNRAINCVYTVPVGKALFIYNLLFGGSSNVANRPVRFITKATYDNISSTPISFFMPYTNVVICDGTIDVPIEAPTKFPAGVDIKVNAVSPDGAAYGSVAMRGWIETA